MKTKQLITTLSIAALTLTGCGNSDEPQTSEDQQAHSIESTEGAGTMQAREYEIHHEHSGHATLPIPADTTTLSIAALTLTGCGNSDEPQTSEDQQAQGIESTEGAGTMQPGEYEIHPELGGHATLQIPADTTSEEVAPFEEYRQENNLEPV